MANFVPLKNYILFCLDKMIEMHGLRDPFLDAGCGIADVSAHLAARGWKGTAVDISPEAARRAAQTLSPWSGVQTRCGSLLDITGSFQTVLLMDVLEHLEDDAAALRALYDLTSPGGFVVIATTSNPREWRWDDDYYGHVRRYTLDHMKTLLRETGFIPVVIWDFTYPFFWGIRRAYTRLKARPQGVSEDKRKATLQSATRNAWDVPIISGLVSGGHFFWRLIYRIQFRYFRNKLDRGHEMLVLARRPAPLKEQKP